MRENLWIACIKMINFVFSYVHLSRSLDTCPISIFNLSKSRQYYLLLGISYPFFFFILSHSKHLRKYFFVYTRKKKHFWFRYPDQATKDAWSTVGRYNLLSRLLRGGLSGSGDVHHPANTTFKVCYHAPSAPLILLLINSSNLCDVTLVILAELKFNA